MNQPSYLFTMEHGKVTIGAEILWPQTETDLGNSEPYSILEMVAA